MFGRSRLDPDVSSSALTPAAVLSLGELALDAVGAILRSLGEFALDQEKQDATSFATLAERWAQHVLLAMPPPNVAPGAVAPGDARRDWAGVRAFVADYCRESSRHAQTVTADLRQVVWVFIQNLSHTFNDSQETDGNVRDQLARLESLVRSPTTGDLKKEVMSTVVAISQLMEDRRRRQRTQMDLLGSQVQTLGHELESARRDSETDPLTRLFNRRAFDEYLARSVELYRAFGHETCLLLVDIDQFKGLNDGFGHMTGDEALRKVADGITRVFLRKSDFVARTGGDEMAVILRETALTDAVMLSERLLRAVRAVDIERSGTRVAISTSVGIARLGPGQDAAAWIEAADQALYRAKNAGRNRAVAAP